MEEGREPREVKSGLVPRRGAATPNGGARSALVRCRVTMTESTASSVAANAMKKGDVLATARFAGIQAVKQSALLLPGTRSVHVKNVHIDFVVGDAYVDVEVRVGTDENAGVAIEAFSAATVAALTVYDMCKAVDRDMSIGEVALWEESAGGEALWRRGESNVGADGAEAPSISS